MNIVNQSDFSLPEIVYTKHKLLSVNGYLKCTAPNCTFSITEKSAKEYSINKRQISCFIKDIIEKEINLEIRFAESLIPEELKKIIINRLPAKIREKELVPKNTEGFLELVLDTIIDTQNKNKDNLITDANIIVIGRNIDRLNKSCPSIKNHGTLLQQSIPTAEQRKEREQAMDSLYNRVFNPQLN